MQIYQLLNRAALVTLLFDLGCGGSIDLAKIKENSGLGSNAGAFGSAGAAGGGSAGRATNPGAAGGDTNPGDKSSDDANPGDMSSGGDDMNPVDGGTGPDMNPGDMKSGGDDMNQGDGGMNPVDGGMSGDPATSCKTDDDCTECTTPTDPAGSSCYIPCCDSVPLNQTTCSNNWHSWMTTCNGGSPGGCTALCNPKPKARCEDGQCVHGQ